ncbi:MAG: hypothetical protein CL760_10595 [Chloroflexi bacterium]|nr:hypothetical protein [Chloroflexota bacterium]|tara:strand:+ start:63347 stop:65539 length:2193 start_codon:yes stop_codon:yes gene_type:complete
MFKEQIKKIVNSKVHKNIFYKIFEAEDFQEPKRKLIFMLKSYSTYMKNRSFFRNQNIFFEDFFKNEDKYSFSNFEHFNDTIEKKLIRHKAFLIQKRILSKKHLHLKDFKTIYILEELVNLGFTSKEVQDFIGKKILILKNSEDFNNSLLELVEGKKNWSKEGILRIITDNLLKKDKDYNIVFDENNCFSIAINSFKAAKCLGVKMWCISRDEEMFLHYMNHRNKTVVFRYDFTKSYSELDSTTALLFNPINNIEEIYLKNDDYINKENNLDVYNKMYSELKHEYPKITSQKHFFENIIKHKAFQIRFLNKENQFDFTSFQNIEKLFNNSIHIMEEVDVSLLEQLENPQFNSLMFSKDKVSMYELLVDMENIYHYDLLKSFETCNANIENAIDFYTTAKDSFDISYSIFNFILKNKCFELFDYINEEKELEIIFSSLQSHERVVFFNDFVFLENENIIKNEIDLRRSEQLFNLLDINEKSESIKSILYTQNEKSKKIVSKLNKIHKAKDKNTIINIFQEDFFDVKRNKNRFFSVIKNQEDIDFIFSEFKICNKKNLNAFLNILFEKRTNLFKEKNKFGFEALFEKNRIKENVLFFGSSGQGKSAFNWDKIEKTEYWVEDLFIRSLESIESNNNIQDFSIIVKDYLNANPDIVPETFELLLHAREGDVFNSCFKNIIRFFHHYEVKIDKNNIYSHIDEIEKSKKDLFILSGRGQVTKEKPDFKKLKLHIKHL